MSRAGPGRAATRDAVAKFAIALLACLRGSICLYQGEELGLAEAELAFEDLRDPYGIRFWPGYKGRDGCRTPMVWEAQAEQAASRRASRGCRCRPNTAPLPWIASRRDQDSVLARYRAVLACPQGPSGPCPWVDFASGCRR